MKIAVITCWWNEEKLAKLFLKAHSYADKIFVILDTEVTDRSREILKTDPRVVIEPITMPAGFDDGLKIAAINVKMHSLVGQFDWVVAVDSDEFICDDIRLKLENAGRADVFKLKLWEIYRHHSESDFDPDGDPSQRKHGTPPRSDYIKPCIIRPSLNKHWSVGCHSIVGYDMRRSSRTSIFGTHWHHADLVVVSQRSADRRQRLSENNIAKNWGRNMLNETDQVVRDRCESSLNCPPILFEDEKLKIAVITCWWNEEKLAKLFLKAHSYADKIFVLLDTQSTDRSREIASADPRVEIIPIDMPGGFDDGIKVHAINVKARTLHNVYDWVIAVDSDEFLLKDPRPELLVADESKVVKWGFWDIFRSSTELDPFNPDGELSQRTHGVWGGHKHCIAKPHPHLTWEVGCHNCREHPRNVSKIMITGAHWNSADPEIAFPRRMARSKRLSKNNIDRRWGYQYVGLTEAMIAKHLDSHLNDPKVV